MTKKFGSFTAVNDLNLKIQGTKCVGFLGPNGAGKTTTMKMFTGLISATSGSALINGVDVSKDKKAALASCTTLIETPEIYPSLTPREALELSGALRGMRPDEVEFALGRALDSAILAGLPSFRIIHGKGTGKLRQGVREYLRANPVVQSQEPGKENEGGDGVTIVKLALAD